MDLSSMLNNNEPAASRVKSQPPAQSSPAKPPYTSYSEPPRHDFSPSGYPSGTRERPPQPPPLYTANDPRSPGASSNYVSAQSPYHHTSASTSTLSGGLGSYPFPSPGHATNNQQYAGPPAHPNNGPFVPSPSPHLTQPTTPGPHGGYVNQHRPQSSHSAASSSPSYMHSYPPRESPAPSVPPQNSQGRHFSPYPQQGAQPATPLGPPMAYQRPSPKIQRHPSELEHTRTYSTGSYGSAHASEPSMSQRSLQQTAPRESVSRQFSYDMERERSQSVSPKTIIQPGQQRQLFTESPKIDRTTPGARSHDRAPSEQRSEIVQPARLTEPLQTPTPMPAPPVSHQRAPSSSQASSTYQSPVALPNNVQTPRAHNTALPSQGNSHITSLKRDSSAVTGSSASPQPPARKRLRHDEIPIFARSARVVKQKQGKAAPQPRSNDQPEPIVHQQIKHEPAARRVKQEPDDPLDEAPPPPPESQRWEPSIVNEIPHEDMTRMMCNEIFRHIGQVDPPPGGAKFEIEAKLGTIKTSDESRLQMPVLTECILNKENLHGKLHFESSMVMAQHKTLNEFLNDCLKKTREPGRCEMYYKHTVEIDNFYELTEPGKASLSPPIQQAVFHSQKSETRVRITTDIKTNQVVAKIIKCRIADIDVYNPRCMFDYRVSINLEIPWDGDMGHLRLMNEAKGGRGGERQKDRLSYRHFAYQIDLTQVTYPESKDRRPDHELEIEVSPDALRTEIQLARQARPNRYEDLVRGFLDNVRYMSRQFLR